MINNFYFPLQDKGIIKDANKGILLATDNCDIYSMCDGIIVSNNNNEIKVKTKDFNYTKQTNKEIIIVYKGFPSNVAGNITRKQKIGELKKDNEIIIKLEDLNGNKITLTSNLVINKNDINKEYLLSILEKGIDKQYVSIGSSEITNFAAQFIGWTGNNFSGYGFADEWCASFVSYCAISIGLNKQNRYGWAPTEGGRYGKDSANSIQTWFKNNGFFRDNKTIPQLGWFIFFDWENSFSDIDPIDHIGIVEYVQDNKIHTIEGNSNDEVRRREYDFNSQYIYGYGNPY